MAASKLFGGYRRGHPGRPIARKDHLRSAKSPSRRFREGFVCFVFDSCRLSARSPHKRPHARQVNDPHLEAKGTASDLEFGNIGNRYRSARCIRRSCGTEDGFGCRALDLSDRYDKGIIIRSDDVPVRSPLRNWQRQRRNDLHPAGAGVQKSAAFAAVVFPKVLAVCFLGA